MSAFREMGQFITTRLLLTAYLELETNCRLIAVAFTHARMDFVMTFVIAWVLLSLLRNCEAVDVFISGGGFQIAFAGANLT
jgi:hypothetical protein